jgi:hypothetical protein
MITGHKVVSHGRAKTSASSVEPLRLCSRPLTAKRGSPGGSPYRSPATRSYSPTRLSPYARRRRKNHVARVNVNMAMTAIGQMLPITSAAGMLFKKTPFTMIIIYRSGLA